MATFNIYGTCICRDIFAFVPDNTHEIKYFLQSSSPIVNFIYRDKPKKLMTFDDFKNTTGGGKTLSHFQQKCIINDYNKTVVDYFAEKTDYFVTDLVFMANTNLIKEIYEDGQEHYWTRSLWFMKACSNELSEFIQGKKLYPIDRLQLLDEIGYQETLDRYIDWLTVQQGYKQEQIILIENMRAHCWTDGETLQFFETGTRLRVRDYLHKFYNYMEQKLPNCHVIKMPFGEYSDEHHKWGLTDLHFDYAYYEYAYKCIDAIVDQPVESKNIIAHLRDEYSERNIDQICKLLEGSFAQINGEQLLPDWDMGGNDHYLALPGTKIYEKPDLHMQTGTLDTYAEVLYTQIPFAKLSGRNEYVEFENCVRGVSGSQKWINAYWQTANRPTYVILNDHSILVGHNGIASNAQMNLVCTLDHSERLRGQRVTLSVWARVLRLTDGKNQAGGTIGIINAPDYHSGKFYAKTVFKNTSWKRIFLSVTLPDKDFNGVTVCFRANASAVENGQHAIVEYCKPKLELGGFATRV